MNFYIIYNPNILILIYQYPNIAFYIIQAQYSIHIHFVLLICSSIIYYEEPITLYPNSILISQYYPGINIPISQSQYHILNIPFPTSQY